MTTTANMTQILIDTMREIQHQNQELVDRARRTETRLTRFIEAQGFETGVRKPYWSDGAVVVPSFYTTLQDIIACVPDGHTEEYGIVHKGRVVMTIFADTE